MIPRDFIIEWREMAPWSSDSQVEQDLVISRALVELFSSGTLRDKLVFRGGTALHKLHLPRALRYSEDLDFIQSTPEPIGQTFDAIRDVLDPWLGKPRRELKDGVVKLLYRFETEDGLSAKLKVEINSREHFAAQETIAIPYQVKSRWYSGSAQVPTLSLPWLLGSKLRALYQRRKGRDLYDLFVSLKTGLTSPELVAASFSEHLKAAGQSISRAELEENLHHKMTDRTFLADLSPLLAASSAKVDMLEACEYVLQALISRVAGHAWRVAD
jgi:predicted nucleotidyltransferase component of viral defense system